MQYTVGYIRSQGIECKWARASNGGPIILGHAEDGRWYAIDARMWKDAEKIGLPDAFRNHTALGAFFSIPI